MRKTRQAQSLFSALGKIFFMLWVVRQPLEEEMPAYYELRWRLLRAPWMQPRGSERDEFEQEAFHCVAASKKNNEIVGVGRLHFLSPPAFAQIRFMAVLPEWRGKGVGSSILAVLEQKAVEKGAKQVVLNGRENAIKFYQEHGYAVEGGAEALFGIPHFKMSKKI